MYIIFVIFKGFYSSHGYPAEQGIRLYIPTKNDKYVCTHRRMAKQIDQLKNPIF